MRLNALLVCLLIPTFAAAKHRKDVPAAPLPAVVANAKRVLLVNGGGSNLAYDAFYSAMAAWGRYQIVGSPQDADLVIEVAYHVDHGGTDVWSSTNTYTGTTQIYSDQIVDPQLALTVYDARTKTALWSETDHRRLARRQKNREKETVKSVERLVSDLRARVSIPAEGSQGSKR